MTNLDLIITLHKKLVAFLNQPEIVNSTTMPCLISTLLYTAAVVLLQANDKDIPDKQGAAYMYSQTFMEHIQFALNQKKN